MWFPRSLEFALLVRTALTWQDPDCAGKLSTVNSMLCCGAEGMCAVGRQSG